MRIARPSAIAVLPTPGSPTRDRVVLGPAAENLQDAADLLVAPDHGVDLAFARRLAQVAGVAVQRLVLGLGVLVRHTLPAAHGLHRFEHALLRDLLLSQRLTDGIAALGHSEQQVLGGNVFVAQAFGFVERPVEDRVEVAADVLPADARARDFRELAEGFGTAFVVTKSRLALRREEERPHDGAFVGEEGLDQVPAVSIPW